MNKREALERCRDGWKKLADDPTLHKRDVDELKGLKQNCPCCELCEDPPDSGNTNCANCPLLGYAWQEVCVSDEDHDHCCSDPDSLFRKYTNASRQHNLAAKAIVSLKIHEASIKALADLDTIEAV